ncbi:hypothetical protein ACP9OK_01595 [Pseudomonas sp. B11]
MEVIINGSETLTFSFPLREQVEEFLMDERHQWSWLTKLPPHLSKAATEVQKIFLDIPIFESIEMSKVSDDGKINIGREEQPFIASGSEEGKFVAEAIKNYDYTVGFFALSMQMNIHGVRHIITR